MSASPDANPSLAADNNAISDANPKPYVRKKTVTITQVKANGEVLAEGSEKVAAAPNGKDLCQTGRAEAVLDRSRELVEPKKAPASPTVTYRRKRGVLKPEQPKWKTALSVFTKTCLLLLGLLWLGQMILKWNGNSSKYPFAAMDYDTRVSEVEASLKKTAKMLQVQLDVLDKKVGSEIGIAASELRKQVAEKSALLEEELKKLEVKTDDLGKSLSELKEMNLFSKEEFESFWNELKESRGISGSGKDIGLDDIAAFAKEIVEKEIEKHAADGSGRVDYALASGGAKVVRHSEPFVFGKPNNWLAAAKARFSVHANAQKMLQPSFGEPGQCFALQGSSGFVEIKLRAGIIPEAVTLEHVSKSVAYDRSSAPKECQVSAWFEGPDDELVKRPEKMFLLTEFSYDLEKSNAQTFNIETADSGIVNMVRLDFTSNHGSSSLTCIYRFRVHGHEPHAENYSLAGAEMEG